MYESRIDLAHNARAQSIALLNARLADAIDLSTHAKQAHWNVKGPNFIALHELFDQIHTTAEEHIDTIAERITALGGIAEGTSAVVAEKTGLPKYPLAIAAGPDHVAALANSIAKHGKEVRAAIDSSADWGDADTADLFTGVSRDLDKYLWFLEAHLHGAR